MTVFITCIFIIGYLLIATEEYIHINKAATALITGVLCWTVYILYTGAGPAIPALKDILSETSSILFFLIGAMTVVELIDAHDGFSLVYAQIRSRSYRRLLWVFCIIAFILSAALDNLTTAIVMVTVINKLITDREKRRYFIGMVVIAANAGGAWSPIGDVTTTMLWTGGRISTSHIIAHTLLPSLASMVVPVLLVTIGVKGSIPQESVVAIEENGNKGEKRLIFFTGLGILLLVPVFKTVTGLPPYMGILLGMAILWVITGLLHKNKSHREKYSLSVSRALNHIDMPSVLFFFGILLAVGTLEVTGQLHALAEWLGHYVHNQTLLVSITGVLSSIIDNVPLVAAAMGMYPLSMFPADHSFWLFLSYCAGTGGSLLIIGSAAGIAAMGIGEMDFAWYLKRISWLALAGFAAGIGVFLLQQLIWPA